MDFGIEGKNVLIVGASKGIGKAIALAFAKEKTIVTTIARSEELLIELESEMKSVNYADHAHYCKDLLERNNEDFIKQVLSERGVFDVIIQNVGGSLVSRNALGTYDEWLYAWRFNVGIAIELNHILIPPMVERGWGRVIHISSISAKMLRGNPLYASAKEFVNSYVTTVGRFLAPTGVIMSAVMPGAISFPGSYWDNKQRDINPGDYGKSGNDVCKEFLSQHQAVNRFGTTEEVANVVLFLASTQASFMQSAIVPVDGGNM